MGLKTLVSLERTQEIDDFLLLLNSEPIETLDYLICLAANAPMISDGLHEVGRSSVMEEEDMLANAPEGSCPELVGSCAALRDAVGEAFAHVVDEKVREEIRCLIGERGTWAGEGAACNHFARGHRGRMALGAAYLCKGAAPVLC